MTDFKDLEVWQKCKELRNSIWEFCNTFPAQEKFRLADQMIRASRSVTANIAEGYGRFHYQENIQFCRQARGSLYELMDHLDVCKEHDYITPDDFDRLDNSIKKCIWILNGYIKYLKNQKSQSTTTK
jgi:four helix bundle protein